MTYDYSRSARERRQAAWQAGKDYAEKRHLADAALEVLRDLFADDYDRYLALQGIADHLTAVGRDLAGLDQRSTPIVGKRK